MMKFFSFIFFIFTISGCSYLSNKFESMAERKETSVKATVSTLKNNFCPAGSKIQYISEDEALLKFYKTLNPSIFENKNISFIQKAVMFTLIEMSRRPDESSPYARLQVYLKLNGKSYYFDFRPKKLEDDTKMSSLKGLDYLTKKFLPNQTLSGIAAGLDKIVPNNINVSTEFENFLHDNREDLLKNETLTARFFKGDENLTKYETYERMSFKSLVQQYQSPLYSKDSDYEFDRNGLDANKSKNDNYQANCNYDISKEFSLRDELLASESKKSHTIGISDGDDFFLAATSGALYRPFKTTPKMSYFMKARPSPIPLPVCELKGKSQDIVLFSSDGRNPVQHLQHLISYDIDQVDSSYTLNELLNFSRHLFLSNPDRILYESKRGRKAQLDFFLAMNFPIYHVESLGNVFGHASFKTDNKQQSSLHIDDRSKTRLWCK
ncbi:MAG: hypothetical protein H7177_16645 [Rhizobacter sp.]|nr:hypothetical protein [Bacteriovorax sp.]